MRFAVIAVLLAAAVRAGEAVPDSNRGLYAVWTRSEISDAVRFLKGDQVHLEWERVQPAEDRYDRSKPGIGTFSRGMLWTLRKWTPSSLRRMRISYPRRPYGSSAVRMRQASQNTPPLSRTTDGAPAHHSGSFLSGSRMT